MKDSHVADDVTRAAVELFATQGYANTSVQQIVEAAGVTKGAMYHYFESKDDLLFGIYETAALAAEVASSTRSSRAAVRSTTCCARSAST